MDVPQLPVEILVEIACVSLDIFRSMLALRPVVEYLRANRAAVINRFTIMRIPYGHGNGCVEYVIKREPRIKGNIPMYLHHREGGLPAYICCCVYSGAKKTKKTKYWYKAGYLHRDSGPAVKSANRKIWYQNGVHHRGGDLPALICPDGYKAWYREGILWRDVDSEGYPQPIIINSDGGIQWKVDENWYYGGDISAIRLRSN